MMNNRHRPPVLPTGNRLPNLPEPPLAPRNTAGGVSPLHPNTTRRNNNDRGPTLPPNNRTTNGGVSQFTPNSQTDYNSNTESNPFLYERHHRKSPSTRKKIGTATDTLKKQLLEAMKTVDRIGTIACTGGKK
jgi:hypothetical protein